MTTLTAVRASVRSLADPETARGSRRFFKTAAGEYGEGDQFLGIRVPALRVLAREFRQLSVKQAFALLRSPWHEERLLALMILIHKHGRARADEQAEIYRLYLANTQSINSWDLVDVSAEHIVGPGVRLKNLEPLKRLARSALVWERRIAIIATFFFIKQKNFRPTLTIARMLLKDRHDLIHKAVGWMLREVGQRDQEAEEGFLRQHHRVMPRTMLRYAIERFPEPLRKRYLLGEM